MAKRIPDVLPVSPLSLACPLCKAKPNHDCTSISSYGILHVARIRAAAARDMAKRKKKNREANQAAAEIARDASDKSNS